MESKDSPGEIREKAFRLLRNAERQKNDLRYGDALATCRKALRLCPDDPELIARARTVSGYLAPGYHLPMMNDTRRNEMWDQAIRRVIRPDMRVLEIGTGAGMLSMMAARAGAIVVTCEFQGLLADMAREIVERNGLSSRIRVLTKSSYSLRMGTDLEEPADLLLCDNFSDDFFSFNPLMSIADARERLLKPGAACLPAAGSVHLALGDWANARRFFQAGQACGFDISPAGALVPPSRVLKIGDADVSLLSEGQRAFGFDFKEKNEGAGFVELELEASQDCTVTGIIQWIRLQLDQEFSVDSRPAPGSLFFSNPCFHPLVGPVSLGKGESIRVAARHSAERLLIWQVAK